MKTKLALLLLLSVTSYAQEFKASINDLAFMSGTWTMKHEWGDMEEFWGPPMGNSLISSYRCVKDGKVVFYEFVVIEQVENVPVMKLRHFNPGSIGWEDKNSPLEYPLVSLSKNKAVFEAKDKSLRLIYQLTTGNLEVILEEKNKNNGMEKMVFAYKRKK
ncbi:DUF6265 family protein [Dyadobacter frigoris]|uniref:DUF6265 domain-containing protein n=1 Tax=Dyadobacter frigoris TaxID=2576211 RepID=A0A4U6CPY7_9BACT|nr:DUF6265 family protein [Dyadobacter frigoris]TKT85685.1 hypothetical protein FDK13_33520 [Dyadobacter frigoris]GLU57321.1 hypothetical protein Dfri01_67820 [Dyadobacter frigoris]